MGFLQPNWNIWVKHVKLETLPSQGWTYKQLYYANSSWHTYIIYLLIIYLLTWMLLNTSLRAFWNFEKLPTFPYYPPLPLIFQPKNESSKYKVLPHPFQQNSSTKHPSVLASGCPLVMVPVLSSTAQFKAQAFSQTPASCHNQSRHKKILSLVVVLGSYWLVRIPVKLCSIIPYIAQTTEITKHFRYLNWRNPHLYKLHVRLM